MKKILILASNPRRDLKLDREIRDLKKAVERSGCQNQLAVEVELAVRPQDLQDLFLYHKPYIVHFCGHGTGEKGLVFEDEAGREQIVGTEAIVNLFRLFAAEMDCALLNACYSEAQASAIVQHVNYVIGMQQEILDSAAYFFSVGFYRGLGYGESIERSYELGCNAIELQLSNTDTFRKLEVMGEIAPSILPEHQKPVLRKRVGLAPVVETSTQPPEFVSAIAKEGDLKRYQDQARESWDGFGQVKQAQPPLTQHEYRHRQVLLGKVQEFWVEGVMKRSLYAETLIELGLQNRPDAVFRYQPFEQLADIPAELDQSFEQLQDTSIFDQIGQGKTLLILGEPGAGKTIALLKLAERLVQQTAQDLSQPIPIVLNLASWAARRQAIADWLVEELREKYQVPKALSKPWIEQEQLTLLLDGLDEVKAEHRNDCVRSINQFIDTHSATEIVVCSRIRDYEALTERLKLRSAICLQPLTFEQVDRFLETAGNKLAGVRTLLQQDPELQTFAQTPLILNIMSWAYKDWSTEALMQQLGNTENRYQHLFDAYIDRMLQRRGAALPYPKEKILRWLRWLARQMVREGIY